MKITFNSVFDQITHIYPPDRPSVLLNDVAFYCAGYATAIGVTNYIGRTLPFIQNIQRSLCIMGSLSVIVIGRHIPKICVVTLVIANLVIFVVGVKTVTLSPREFKKLLLQKVILPPNVVVNDTVDLSGLDVESLPINLEVRGSLILTDCKHLKALSKRLKVQGDLIAYRCYRLEQWPEQITVGGQINLAGCALLRNLSDVLTVSGDLDLRGCFHLTLPHRLTVLGDLLLNYHPDITSLPADLVVKNRLFIGGCQKLRLHSWHYKRYQIYSFLIDEIPQLNPLSLR